MRKLTFELKALDTEKGEFEGLASVYGVEDANGDRVEPGAFKRTLDHKGGKVPLLWQHNPSDVIGISELTDSPEGLRIKGRLNLAIGQAREAFELIKQGAVNGLSIGYDTVQEAFKDGIRLLKEVRLWEVSVVTFPANPEALIASVKAEQENKFDAMLAQVIGMAALDMKVDAKNVKAAIRSLDALLVKAAGLVGPNGLADVHPTTPAPAPAPDAKANDIAKAAELVEKFVNSIKPKRS
jgi:uncharacterized protein